MLKQKKASTVTVCLCLIVRNEKKSAEVIFPKIPLHAVNRCIVIDGHSTDGTQAFFRKNKVPVYTQTINGLGGAAFEARKQCKTDAMIFFHPDGNEEPSDIIKVADMLRAGEEFVIPSRMIAGARNEEDDQVIKPRKWFNQTLALLANFFWNEQEKYCSEIVQGFRGIKCTTFDTLQLTRTDLTMDFHMVIRALKFGVRITEFPTIEHNRLFGQTNFNSLSTGWKELTMMWEEISNPETFVKKTK